MPAVDRSRAASATRPRGGPPRPVRRRWRHFARRYGWRAYALPVLVVITIAELVRGTPRAATPHAAALVRTAGGGSAAGVQVEGSANAAYRPGSTPQAVMINLGSDVTSCATNSAPQLLLVSIGKQRLWVCEGHRQVNTTPVTTGSLVNDHQTPLGSWRVQDKQRDRYLVGPGYRDYVQYWMPFDGDFGFHDAQWQTIAFGSKQWRTQGSHGCVHVPTPTMAWLYDWATPGSTVVTIEN